MNSDNMCVQLTQICRSDLTFFCTVFFKIFQVLEQPFNFCMSLEVQKVPLKSPHSALAFCMSFKIPRKALELSMSSRMLQSRLNFFL